MRVIIDTNVLISAILKNRDPEDAVLFVVENCTWIVTEEILEEYFGVLRRPKFRFSEATIQTWEEEIRKNVVINAPFKIVFERDINDAKFLSCAISSSAEYFITGDRDFAHAGKLVTTTILTVAQFKKFVMSSWK